MESRRKNRISLHVKKLIYFSLNTFETWSVQLNFLSIIFYVFNTYNILFAIISLSKYFSENVLWHYLNALGTHKYLTPR